MKSTNNLLTQEVAPWKLRLAEYIARHHEQWQRGAVFALFFSDIVIIGLLGFAFVSYVSGIPRETTLLAELASPFAIDFAGYHARHRVVPLRIDHIQAIPARKGEYDIIAIISNPNEIWAALDAVVQFQIENTNFSSAPIHVLPREQRAVAVFRQHISSGAPSPRASLQTVYWRKLKRAPASLAGIQYRNIRYTQLPTGTTNLDFMMFNGTPYSYWRVPAVVIGWQGKNIVGAHEAVIERFRSGEERPVSLAWNYSLSDVSHTTVDVQIDVTNTDAFMDPPSTLLPPF